MFKVSYKAPILIVQRFPSLFLCAYLCYAFYGQLYHYAEYLHWKKSVIHEEQYMVTESGREKWELFDSWEGTLFLGSLPLLK